MKLMPRSTVPFYGLPGSWFFVESVSDPGYTRSRSLMHVIAQVFHMAKGLAKSSVIVWSALLGALFIAGYVAVAMLGTKASPTFKTVGNMPAKKQQPAPASAAPAQEPETSP
jgi:hypothetical protein